jgi:DNA-binding beta-propeller fold protein YncE
MNIIRIQSKCHKRFHLSIVIQACLAGIVLAMVGSAVQAQAPQTDPTPKHSMPMRLAETPDALIVGEHRGQKVSIVDPVTMEITGYFTTINAPHAVAFSNGRAFVGTDHADIEVYQYASSDKTNFKNPKNDKKQLPGWGRISPDDSGAMVWGPSGIDFSPSDIEIDEGAGLMFVADKWGRRVLVLDLETGSLISMIGDPAVDPVCVPGPFGSTCSGGTPRAVAKFHVWRPEGIALDVSGQRIFMTDAGVMECGYSGCSPISNVKVYDYNGTFLGLIEGKYNPDPVYRFSRAAGIDLGAGGRVYMTDLARGQVLVFDETGVNQWTGVGTFGRRGLGLGELALPQDVIADEETSSVYVTNYFKARIEVFAMGDMMQW